jgi:hypothetical protein
MDDDDVTEYDNIDSSGDDMGESWLAEQARLVLLEDGG